jgi:NADH-quinone oxidoreductase E subunit
LTPDLVGGLESPDYASHDRAGHEPYQPVFSRGSVARQELDKLITHYPSKMAALLPALWIVQRERGWVSDEGMAEVAELLELTPAYVKGVVTFYTMYHQHPVGKYFIQVCTTSPCGICGADDVVRALLKHTNAGELGVTSPDDRFTVIEVECLGACGFATPVMINEEFIESVTADKVPELLERLA